ncbi:MAG: GNAT family N-acetyltransferase [Rubrivivax sp.]
MHEDPATIDASDWNALLARQAEPTPFMRHECLLALHASGSAVDTTGWAPRFVTLHTAGAPDAALVGACPLYLKSHSYGEYVFDWAWADAYERHGLDYYPKGLVAVPFTPVPGSRLLAVDDAARSALVGALRLLAKRTGLSSLHVLFPDAADRAALAADGWLLRDGVQFHWTRDPTDPCPDFATLLARLQRDKRKKIQQERRRVADAGVSFEVLVGDAIDTPAWDFFHHCYTLTYRAHHSTPYLTRDFFRRMAATMARHWVLFVAHQGGERVAASLVAVDPERGVAWGRYWGATRFVPCLHFEACYYQPLQWCLTHGVQRFEGGAQGEHKMARGLMPVRTASAHWLSDRRFAAAVGDFLGREGEGVARYVDELNERSPFKAVDVPR